MGPAPRESDELVAHRHKRTFHSLIGLALESNRVVALRWMTLMLGGSDARREAKRMVSEKIDAAIKAGQSAAAGASAETSFVNTDGALPQMQSG